MKLKISVFLLIICMILSGCVPHKNIVAYCQEMYNPNTSVELEFAEIEPNNDDDDTAAVIVAVIVVVLVICIVIYCCDSGN